MKIHRTNKVPVFNPFAIEIDSEQELKNLENILEIADSRILEYFDEDEDKAERLEKIIKDIKNRIKITQK